MATADADGGNRLRVLPWSHTVETTSASLAGNIVAQGDGGYLTCRISVDGELKDQRSAQAANVLVSPLEEVAKANTAATTPAYAPSVQAMTRMGESYGESDSDSTAIVVLEGAEPLGTAR